MATDESFKNEYLDLLIIQYHDKEKAKAETELTASHFSRVFDFFRSFFSEFDLDTAVGAQLDILGKLVGIPRVVPFTTPKNFFGFSNNPNSKGFGLAPFFNMFSDSLYTDTQLTDSEMRILIRAKAAQNAMGPYMVSDDRISIQDVIRTAFEGRAFVLDNYDMTLTLYVDATFDEDMLRIIKALGLLPSPQGVGYKAVISYSPTGTFGFSNNPSSKGFGLGVFARITDI